MDGVHEPISESDSDRRWGFLDDEPDACCVLTRRMEVIYLNAAARALVPGFEEGSAWFGQRCWDVFPAREGCATGCPAVQSVARGTIREIEYCEESVYPEDGTPIVLDVAIVPLTAVRHDGGAAVLVLRPKDTKESLEDLSVVATHVRRLLV